MPAYGAAPYLPAIVLERPVYLREMSDGLYSPFTYLLYKVRPMSHAGEALTSAQHALKVAHNTPAYQQIRQIETIVALCCPRR